MCCYLCANLQCAAPRDLFPEVDSRGFCPYETSEGSLNCRVYVSWLERLYKDKVVCDAASPSDLLEDASSVPF